MQLGDPMSLYDRPQTGFVADFLGVTNLFPGQVLRSDGGVNTVRLDGCDSEIDAVADHPAGAEVSVCVRPDAVTIDDSAAGRGGANRFSGVVHASSFLGTHVRYRVDIDDGISFDVVTFSRRTIFARGDTVAVSVDPADVRLLSE